MSGRCGRRRRRRGPIAGAVVLVALAVLAGHDAARAGGIRDLEDGWVLPAGLVHELLAGGPAGAAPGDSSLAATQTAAGRTWVRWGQGRLYGLPELPLLGVEAGRAQGPMVVVGSWQRLGDGLYCEQAWRLRLGWGRQRRLWVGVGRQALSLAGEALGSASQAEVGLEVGGPTWRLEGRWPLLAAPAWYGEAGARPWLCGSVAADGALLGLALDRQAGGTPVFECEGSLRLGSGLALGLRAEPATGTLGPTLALRRGGLLLRSCHLAHPELGLTHRWSLGWGRPEGSR